MSGIDWADSPLREFGGVAELDEEGKTTGRMLVPYGEGKAQDVLFSLHLEVDALYAELVAPEDYDRLEQTGEVPIIRESVRHYEPIGALSIPGLLDPKTFWVPSIGTSGLVVYRGSRFPDWKGDVFSHRHMRKERVVLEYNAHLASMWRQLIDACSTEGDDTARRSLEPCQHH